MNVHTTSNSSAQPPLAVRLTQQGERDNVWLNAARWLRLAVQLGLLVCLVVALHAGWELTEALRWNVRLAQQSQVLGAEVVPGGAPAIQTLATAATTGHAVVAAGSATAGTARPVAVQDPVASAASMGGVVAAGAVADATSAPGARPGRDRSSTRTAAAAAPVWADDAASAASAAAAAASAAAAAPQVPAWLSDGSPPQWRFAQALGLARQGDLDGALARYRSVFDDAALGNLARYNSANTLLREAMRLSATAAPGQALVMFELAKEGYRGVLRRDPSFWAARYNLERALQLQPDGETVAAEPAQQAERAATTMRSVSRGLP